VFDSSAEGVVACTNKKSKQQVVCCGIEGYRVKLEKNWIKVEHDDNSGETSVGEVEVKLVLGIYWPQLV